MTQHNHADQRGELPAALAISNGTLEHPRSAHHHHAVVAAVRDGESAPV